MKGNKNRWPCTDTQATPAKKVAKRLAQDTPPKMLFFDYIYIFSNLCSLCAACNRWTSWASRMCN